LITYRPFARKTFTKTRDTADLRDRREKQLPSTQNRYKSPCPKKSRYGTDPLTIFCSTSNESQVKPLPAYHTINEYVDYLEGAFLLRRLFPWHANISKRLVKRPKVYWWDSGLLHSLLDVSRFAQLMLQPWVGASWEGFVIEQTLAMLEAVGKHADASYFRTSDGYGLDMLLSMDGHRWAVEIKLTSNPTMDMLNRLRKAAGFVDADRRVLVCRTSKRIENDTTLVTNLSGWLKRLME